MLACNAFLLAGSAASCLNGANAFKMASGIPSMAINAFFGSKPSLHGTILMTAKDSSLAVDESLQSLRKTPRPELILVHQNSMLSTRISLSPPGVSISPLGLNIPFTSTPIVVSGIKPLQLDCYLTAPYRKRTMSDWEPTHPQEMKKTQHPPESNRVE